MIRSHPRTRANIKMSKRKLETTSFKLCRCCCKWRCRCLIPRRRKPHPPFNVASKKDTKLGLHPDMCALPPTSAAVGSYHPHAIEPRPRAVISWKRQKKTEEFTADLGCKMEVVAEQRDLMKTGRGPGIHEITRWPDDILTAACRNVRKTYNVDFGMVARFEPSYMSTTPGPGYTLKTHNPHYYLDQKRLKGFSCLPSFEYDGLQPRFRQVIKSWSIASNRYNVKHPDSLEVFLKKVTGKRGPYDLFTGPRDESSIVGYWIQRKIIDYNNWPWKFPDGIEKLSDRCNYFKGKWSINPRFTRKPVMRIMLQDLSLCYKDPDEPGPGHYNPRMPPKPTTLKRYPFDANIEYARPPPSSEIRPGPGRYKIKDDYAIKGHGWTSVFKSVVPRTIGVYMPPSYSEFY